MNWICAALYGRVGPSSSRSAGLFGRARPTRPRGDTASADLPQRCRSSGCHQPSPTGSDAGDDCEIEREMGEDMAHRAEVSALRLRRLRGPVAPGQRGHSAEQPLGGPANQPDVPVALDPVSDAMAVRPRRTVFGAGSLPALPLAKAAQWLRSGQIAASRRSSAGRWSRRDPSSPATKSPARSAGIISSTALDLASWRICFSACSRAITRSTFVSTAARVLAERDRRDRRRRIGADARQLAKLRGGGRESAARARLRGRRRSGCARGHNSRGPPIRRGCPRRCAAASASIVGQRAMKRSNRGVTAATVVCWSMTSLSQTR